MERRSKKKSLIEIEDLELKVLSNLYPKAVYGLRKNVVGNVNFTYDQKVIYPVEGVFAIHDYATSSQRFLKMAGDNIPLFMIMSPTRRFLAVVEKSPFKIEYNISLYDLVTFTKRRDFKMPSSSVGRSLLQVIFSNDARSLIVITEPPDELIYIVTLDRDNNYVEGRPTLMSYIGNSVCIANNPVNHSIIAVGGNGTISFLQIAEQRINVTKIMTGDFLITSMAYLEKDLLLCGTNNDELILFDENGEIKFRHQASELENFDVINENNLSLKSSYSEIGHLMDKRVLLLLRFSRGFTFVIFNNIFVFEKASKFKYERKTVLTIPITIYPEMLYQIKNLAIDSKEEAIVVTADYPQVYAGVLIVPETLKTKYLKLQTLGAFIHIDEIVDISLCSWKTIIMTASRDRTIRIWNYKNDSSELVRKFQTDVNVVELNATGLMAAIAFNDHVRLAQIFAYELNFVKTYRFSFCNDIKFSNYGHYLAFGYGSTITLTSPFYLNTIKHLQGHIGSISSFSFSKSDRYIVSADTSGLIIQWNIESGEQICSISQKGIVYVALAITQTVPYNIYAATSTGSIRQFQNGKLINEISLSVKDKYLMTDICLSRSDKIMFAASRKGDLFNITVPFKETNAETFSLYQFFLSGVTKLRFTHDCTMLIAASNAGTLGIWTLNNTNDNIVEYDKDLLKSTEVLIPRYILEEKNETIISLEIRLKKQSEDYQFKISQNEISDGEHLAQVHQTYCAALEELRTMNNEVVKRHAFEIKQLKSQLEDIREELRVNIERMSNQYAERMYEEMHKFNLRRDRMLTIREYYENMMETAFGIKENTVDDMKEGFKRRLKQRRDMVQDVISEMELLKEKFFKYIHKEADDFERYLINQKVELEDKLRLERTQTKHWREKAVILLKSYEEGEEQIEFLRNEVACLNEDNKLSLINIEKLNRNVIELQKEVEERDFAIISKEKRIIELIHKNNEMLKYRGVLSHKITELKAAIAPKDLAIIDKTKHIKELKSELEGLIDSHLKLQLQSSELKDKYLSKVLELNNEKENTFAAYCCIDNVCREIYHVAQNLHSPLDLISAVKDLFHRHSSHNEFKRFIASNQMVNQEFDRRRGTMEHIVKLYKMQALPTFFCKNQVLKKQNSSLNEDVKNLRVENKDLLSAIRRATEHQNFYKSDDLKFKIK